MLKLLPMTCLFSRQDAHEFFCTFVDLMYDDSWKVPRPIKTSSASQLQSLQERKSGGESGDGQLQDTDSNPFTLVCKLLLV